MLAFRPLPVVCTAQPFKPKSKTIVRQRHVKESIQHARLLCQNYEDTVECKLAWEKVEERYPGTFSGMYKFTLG